MSFPIPSSKLLDFPPNNQALQQKSPDAIPQQSANPGSEALDKYAESKKAGARFHNQLPVKRKFSSFENEDSEEIDAALIEYLRIREKLGRPINQIPEARFSQLQRCNQSVQDVRKALSLGPGNNTAAMRKCKYASTFWSHMIQSICETVVEEMIEVIDNAISEYGKSTVEKQNLPQFKKKDFKYLIVAAAIAELLKTGTCDQFSFLFLIYHAPRLKEGETVEVVGDDQIKHNWARSGDITCDGTAEGLGVAFTEDSALGAESEEREHRQPGVLSYAPKPESFYPIDCSYAEVLPRVFKAVKAALVDHAAFKEITEDAQAEFEDLTERGEWENMSVEELEELVGKLWDPYSILSEAFQKAIHQKAEEH